MFHVSCYVMPPMQQQFDEKENPLNSQEARPNFWRSLERNQKIALIVLAVFVLFLIVIWSIQFKRSLTEPFAYKGNNSQDNLSQDATSTDADLKNKDTDADGLSDWDELNIYKTSPYLEDSDSDGIKDGDEIKTGTDPNCPEGKICTGTVGSVSTSSAANSTNNNNLGQGDGASPANPSQADGLSEEQTQQLLDGKLDAATLRRVLKDSGMDEKLYNQLSDEQLMEFYKNTYGAK